MMNGKIILLILILGVLAGQSLAWNMACYEQCGGKNLHDKAIFNGDGVCIYAEGKTYVLTNCLLDCEGIALPSSEDQTKCWCEICKEKDGHMLEEGHQGFCKQPGVKTYISKEECDTEVCAGAGDVKYRHGYCHQETEQAFQEQKTRDGLN